MLEGGVWEARGGVWCSARCSSSRKSMIMGVALLQQMHAACAGFLPSLLRLQVPWLLSAASAACSF